MWRFKRDILVGSSVPISIYFWLVYIDFHTHQHPGQGAYRVFNLPAHASPKVPGSSVGIHPYWLETHDVETLKLWVESTLENKEIVAIGECGIDKRLTTHLTVQTNILNLHIQWAQAYHKPLIIHCVKGHQEVLEALKKANLQEPVIFHGFRGSQQLARQLMDRGYYLGIGDMQGKPSLQQLARTLPLGHLVLETDDSAASIESVYQSVCEMRGITIDALKMAMMETAMVIFGNQINSTYGFELA